MTAHEKPKPLITTSEDRQFWDGVAQGQLLLSRCESCGFHSMPRTPCNCADPRPAYVPSSARGTIYTFIVYHRAFHPGFANDIPYVLCWIMLEEGVLQMARMVDVNPANVRIGQHVHVAFDRQDDQPMLYCRID